MKTVWTDGLEPDIAKEIKGDFKSSLLIRNRLSVILEDKIRVAHKNSLSSGGYDIPNWAYKQADTVGYERALRDVINLISESL